MVQNHMGSSSVDSSTAAAATMTVSVQSIQWGSTAKKYLDAIGSTYEASKSEGMLTIWVNMLYMAALLSANLGVMNLLPLPALDGGRLVFLIIEAIRRKPVNRQIEGMVHFAGLMVLMLLMVVVMYNDILKIF